MATVSLEGVTKVYPNGFEALHELSLTVDEGEFMVLVGPSGCGKTTALRMVAGLEDITSGTLRIGDEIMNDVAPKDREIAMVFQNYALYPHMSVRDNIAFALRLRHMPKPEIATRVDEAAELLGLTEWISQKPGQLSGGQRQRVAMGRAIVREPNVFLMDEPLSNLDAKLRVRMRAEISRIQRRVGVATLYVTHDQVEAMTMGDRVAVLREGVLQQCDTPQALYERPQNLFVAGFMGSPAMNFFEATVLDGARSLRIGSETIALPDSLHATRPDLRGYTDRDLVIGIRPEDLSLPGPGTNSSLAPAFLNGEVDLVEALGSELLVHFTSDAHPIEVADTQGDEAGGLNEGKLALAGQGIARVHARAQVAIGDRARFSFDPHRLHFFDDATGVAIAKIDQPASSQNGRPLPTSDRP